MARVVRRAPQREVSADRRFARQVAVAFGLIFLAAGYSFAFTEVGAWMVFAGVGMIGTGVLLWTPLPTVVGAVTGPLMTIALIVLLYFDRAR